MLLVTALLLLQQPQAATLTLEQALTRSRAARGTVAAAAA
jgi:hypothetical protein